MVMPSRMAGNMPGECLGVTDEEYVYWLMGRTRKQLGIKEGKEVTVKEHDKAVAPHTILIRAADGGKETGRPDVGSRRNSRPPMEWMIYSLLSARRMAHVRG